MIKKYTKCFKEDYEEGTVWKTPSGHFGAKSASGVIRYFTDEEMANKHAKNTAPETRADVEHMYNHMQTHPADHYQHAMGNRPYSKKGLKNYIDDNEQSYIDLEDHDTQSSLARKARQDFHSSSYADDEDDDDEDEEENTLESQVSPESQIFQNEDEEKKHDDSLRGHYWPTNKQINGKTVYGSRYDYGDNKPENTKFFTDIEKAKAFTYNKNADEGSLDLHPDEAEELKKSAGKHGKITYGSASSVHDQLPAGHTWQLSNGLYGAKSLNPDKKTTSYFKDKDAAERYAHGDDKKHDMTNISFASELMEPEEREIRDKEAIRNNKFTKSPWVENKKKYNKFFI